jgi:hypothetical protein
LTHSKQTWFNTTDKNPFSEVPVQIRQTRKGRQPFFKSNLMAGITNPQELREAIERAKTGDTDAIWDIHKYKWYNWYQNIHIKEGSEMDIENTQIFQELESQYPDIHQQVEKQIDMEIERLNHEAF